MKLNIDGNKLSIEVDLNKNFGESGSGKSIVIASSEGNRPIGKDDIKIGLNIYRPKN
jgi:ABC-type dipeptide/oligopeptide/nickel transport system ATPase component